ncbi:MAG: zinc-binding dehydrogenase, partial [Candidatus Kariarchaeaceae archaeon]
SILEYTNKEGVNVVIDPVGASTWEKSIASIAKGGRHIVCGATTGPNADTAIRDLFVKQAKIEGSYMGNNREFVQSMNLITAGHISPVVDSIAPMADLAKSHERLETGKHFGKLVLTI